MDTLPVRLANIAQIAVKLERESLAQGKVPVPPECILPQWALESGWGSTPCGNNYFGIKKTDRHTMQVLKTTHETVTPYWVKSWNEANPERPAKVLKTLPDGKMDVLVDLAFADYPSEEDSVRDYCWLISSGGPYFVGWTQYLKDKDVDKLMRSISLNYATAESYGNLVMTIEHQQNIKQAIALARATT